VGGKLLTAASPHLHLCTRPSVPATGAGHRQPVCAALSGTVAPTACTGGAPAVELEGSDAAVGWWERDVYRELCSVVVQGVCAGGRIRLPPKDLSGDGARVCPPSAPHQLTRVEGVSTHAERPPSLYSGRAAADTGRARGVVKGSAAPDLWLCEHAGGARRDVSMELRA
jgi:hypothetical protein